MPLTFTSIRIAPFSARRALALAILASLGLALGACDGPTLLDPLEVRIDSPAAGATFHTGPVEITGTVVGAANPAVTYSLDGGPHTAVELLPAPAGAFRIVLTEIDPGSSSVVVRARDRGRTAEAVHTFVFEPVTLTVQPREPQALYGRVAAFTGTISVPSLAVRYSIDGRAERPVQQNALGEFRGEAHPLPDGTSRVEVRAYHGDTLVAMQAFDAHTEVERRRYSATVIDVPGSVDVRGLHLGNDGRIAGYWWSTPDAAHPFTWRNGELVQLDSMRGLSGLNNVGQVLGVALGATPQTLIWRDGAYTRVPEFVGARAINDRGHLIRASTAGFWRDGGIVDFASPPGEALGVAAINNHDQIVGGRWLSSTTIRPVFWLSAPDYELVHLPYRAATAFRISDGGHVLLEAWDIPTSVEEFGAVRYVFHHAGAWLDLNAVVGFRTVAADVDAAGVVAGTYSWLGDPRPFTWRDGRTTDVVLDSDEWAVERVWSINDHGQISAGGRHRTTGRRATLLLAPLD